MATKLIGEAVSSGARLYKACKVLLISVNTYRRWSSGQICDERKGSEKNIPRKLSLEEKNRIISICCSSEYKDMNPYEIHASLLDEGIYIASISSFYRVMREYNLVCRHRC